MADTIIVNGDKTLLPQIVTLSQLQSIYAEQSPAIVAEAHPYLDQTLYMFGCGESKFETAAFLAQVGHESGLLKFRKENLNYSAQALRKTFKKYFPNLDIATAYARNPEKIANRVYANRMGNGNENSGDGWRYRGRGYIQLTGSDNYHAFAEYVGMPVDQAIQYLDTIEGAWASGGWYWNERKLDRFDDSPSLFRKLTLLINGGYNGEAHRLQLYNRALKVL